MKDLKVLRSTATTKTFLSLRSRESLSRTPSNPLRFRIPVSGSVQLTWASRFAAPASIEARTLPAMKRSRSLSVMN